VKPAACTRCGAKLTDDNWPEHSQRVRRFRCRECRLQINDARRLADPIGGLIRCAKYRAKKSGLEFSITANDITIPTCCPVLGIELKMSERGAGRQNTAPSLDRIDNTKGYIPGNVEVVSWRANALKRDSTPEEMIALARHYGGR
jgi:hypothetical protein